jgi:hypothetical protein
MRWWNSHPVKNRARSPKPDSSTRIGYYHQISSNASFGPPAAQIPGSPENISRLSRNGNLAASGWYLWPISGVSRRETGIFRGNSRYFTAKREFPRQDGSI